MKASFVISTTEFGEYVSEDGFKITPITRVEKSLTTSNGTLFKHEVIKEQIDLNLGDMGDDQYKILTDLLATNPVTVSYSDFRTGISRSNVQFYHSQPSITARKCINSGSGSYLTYLTDLSLTFEEK